MAGTNKTGFQLEQLIAKQIYDRAMKLPTLEARHRALGHVMGAITQESYREADEKMAAMMKRGPGPDELEPRAGVVGTVGAGQLGGTVTGLPSVSRPLFPNG